MDSKKYISRSVETYAFDEELIARHMVFLAGPRQVGKTVLAKQWLKNQDCSTLYFNWDDISTRQAYLGDNRFFESAARSLNKKDPWIVFDEIHKRIRWRDILKGAYDQFGDEFRFLVTGSARLDLFRRSGDALVGRYNLFHMMPLSLGEVLGKQSSRHCFLEKMAFERLTEAFETAISKALPMHAQDAFDSLLTYGPFPEPFLRQNERFSRRWHQDYVSLIVREELKGISRIVDLDKVENLLLLMPSRITAPLSMANLAADLEVAHTTVKSWLEQLNRLYILFPISPWSRKISRGLKKEKKWYFLDWYYARGEAARIENMVASYLYRACFAMTDMGYGSYRLHYIRTLDKKEIDFLITRDNTPILAVEVKLSDITLARPLRDRKKWLFDTPTLGIQIVNRRNVLKKFEDDTWVVSVERLLANLV